MPQQDAAKKLLKLWHAALAQRLGRPLCSGQDHVDLRAAALLPAELAWQGD